MTCKQKLVNNCVCLFVTLFFLTCCGQNPVFKCGIVYSKSQIFDTLTGQFALPKYFKDFKIWYKDSIVIEEANELSIYTDPYKNETWKYLLDRYIFIDLRSKSFYEYSSFSDTARLLKKYLQEDSVHVDGGWNFYAYRNFMPSDGLETLPDTIIKGIKYSRVIKRSEFKHKGEEFKSSLIGYLRCDQKGTIVTLDRAFSEKMGCPLTRVETRSTPEKFSFITELDFASKTLTKEELKVFSAWEKYAKENPAQKK